MWLLRRALDLERRVSLPQELCGRLGDKIDQAAW
jgi:hypothetical protein